MNSESQSRNCEWCFGKGTEVLLDLPGSPTIPCRSCRLEEIVAACIASKKEVSKSAEPHSIVEQAYQHAASAIGVVLTQGGFSDHCIRWTVEKLSAHRDRALESTPSEKQASYPLPPADANGKRPRLFYWEDAEDCWCPAEGLEVDNIIGVDLFMSDGEINEVRFKRMDMTDAEFAAIPEG